MPAVRQRTKVLKGPQIHSERNRADGRYLRDMQRGSGDTLATSVGTSERSHHEFLSHALCIQTSRTREDSVSAIPPISPVAPVLGGHADAADSPAAKRSPAPGDKDPVEAAKHAAAGGGGFVDSVSLTSNGALLGGSVSVSDGVYVATQPGPPVQHATGNSPIDAANKLVRSVYRIT